MIHVRIAGQRQIAGGVAFAPDQVNRNPALPHASRLAHLALVEADEIGFFGGKASGIDFSRLECVVELCRKCCEFRLHHSSPPKTATSPNTHAGDACPTRIAWFGSPLPHVGVPSIAKVDRSPTFFRLRQNVAEIPR